MSESMTSIQGDAESLKERLWDWLDGSDLSEEKQRKTRDAMNELLDILDFVEDWAMSNE